jgi:hypothetical protein
MGVEREEPSKGAELKKNLMCREVREHGNYRNLLSNRLLKINLILSPTSPHIFPIYQHSFLHIQEKYFIYIYITASKQIFFNSLLQEEPS